MPEHFFLSLQQRLQGAHALIGAAEAHGMLAGMVCGPEIPSMNAWLPLIFGEDFGDSAKGPIAGLATQIIQMSKQLQGSDAFEFALLLPADSEPLAARVDALASWCRGFLTGLHLASPRLPDGEVSELAQDFGAITEAGLDPEMPEAAQEREFTELEEFVRMGVTLIYTELHRPAPPPVRSA